MSEKDGVKEQDEVIQGKKKGTGRQDKVKGREK